MNKTSPKRKKKNTKVPFIPENVDEMKLKRWVGTIPIISQQELLMGQDANSNPDPWILASFGKKIPHNSLPRMSMESRHVDFKNDGTIKEIREFSASEKKLFGTWKKGGNMIFSGAKGGRGSRTMQMVWPKYWLNPYQYQDYVILQDIYSNTIAGRIIDTLVYFTIANGIKPKLEPRDKSQYKDDEEMQKALDDNQFVIDALVEIDKSVSSSGEAKGFDTLRESQNQKYVPFYSQNAEDKHNTFDTPLQNKWSAVLTLSLTFGRNVIIPTIDEDDNEVIVAYEGKSYTFKDIPKILKVIHPRDLGFNHISPQTWRLLGIQLYNSNWILRPDQMMFFEWNSNNPVYGAMFYGYSLMQSMMGSGRALRRIIEVDFPLIAKTRWSGMYWLFFKRQGEGLMTAQQEHQAILGNIRPDGINISLEDNPETDVRVEKIDLDPKIAELIEMARFLIQYMMSQVGMPQGLLFGEETLNRAVLIGKIRSFIQGPIRKYRKWFLQGITDQWYKRMMVTLAQQDNKFKKVWNDFDVIADVEDFHLEDWQELVQAVLMLSQINPLDNEEVGKLLGIDNYLAKIDETKERPPMPGKGGMTVTTPEGKQFGVSDSK